MATGPSLRCLFFLDGGPDGFWPHFLIFLFSPSSVLPLPLSPLSLWHTPSPVCLHIMDVSSVVYVLNHSDHFSFMLSPLSYQINSILNLNQVKDIPSWNLYDITPSEVSKSTAHHPKWRQLLAKWEVFLRQETFLSSYSF